MAAIPTPTKRGQGAREPKISIRRACKLLSSNPIICYRLINLAMVLRQHYTDLHDGLRVQDNAQCLPDSAVLINSIHLPHPDEI